VCDEFHANVAFEEEDANPVEEEPLRAFSATSKDSSIYKVLNMPDDEGRAWEAAQQAE
jgi:hypothetical protein